MIGPRTRFDELMYCLGECATLRKELAIRESEASDQLPAPDPTFGPWCADYGRHTGKLDAAYQETLRQLGLELGDDGRMRALPPAPCGHRPWERNLGRDQLQCDGCRAWRTGTARFAEAAE